jgi:hypothetical protein
MTDDPAPIKYQLSAIFSLECSLPDCPSSVSLEILKQPLIRSGDYIKVKVKLSLGFLTEYCAMKVYWGIASIAPRILDPGTRWRWVVRPSRFTLRERTPRTHWIGGWVGLRAVLDAVMERKIPSPAGNRTLELRSSSP